MMHKKGWLQGKLVCLTFEKLNSKKWFGFEKVLLHLLVNFDALANTLLLTYIAIIILRFMGFSSLLYYG